MSWNKNENHDNKQPSFLKITKLCTSPLLLESKIGSNQINYCFGFPKSPDLREKNTYTKKTEGQEMLQDQALGRLYQFISA